MEIQININVCYRLFFSFSRKKNINAMEKCLAKTFASTFVIIDIRQKKISVLFSFLKRKMLKT